MSRIVHFDKNGNLKPEPVRFVVEATGFLGWWNDQSIKTQQNYIKNHNPKDSNYKIAAAHQKRPQNT